MFFTNWKTREECRIRIRNDGEVLEFNSGLIDTKPDVHKWVPCQVFLRVKGVCYLDFKSKISLQKKAALQ